MWKKSLSPKTVDKDDPKSWVRADKGDIGPKTIHIGKKRDQLIFDNEPTMEDELIDDDSEEIIEFDASEYEDVIKENPKLKTFIERLKTNPLFKGRKKVSREELNKNYPMYLQLLDMLKQTKKTCVKRLNTCRINAKTLEENNDALVKKIYKKNVTLLDKSFNDLWDQQCKISQNVDSWFCKLGEGNKVAELLAGLRFTVSENSEQNPKHILNIIRNLLTTKRSLQPYQSMIKIFLKPLQGALDQEGKDKKRLMWRDLNAFLSVMQVPMISDIVGEYLQDQVGISITDTTSKNDVQQIDRKVDLDKLYKEKCKPDSEWYGSIYCELNKMTPVVAYFIMNMGFNIPKEDKENTKIFKGLEKALIEIAKSKNKLTELIDEKVPFGFKDMSKNKINEKLDEITLQLQKIMLKMTQGKTLSWNDLQTMYDTANKSVAFGINLELLGTGIVGKIVRSRIKNQLRNYGFDLAGL